MKICYFGFRYNFLTACCKLSFFSTITCNSGWHCRLSLQSTLVDLEGVEKALGRWSYNSETQERYKGIHSQKQCHRRSSLQQISEPHTILDTIRAVETGTPWTNALENFIWILYSPEVRLGWFNCKRTQDEVRGSIQGETTSTPSKGSQGQPCLAQSAGETWNVENP